MRGADLPALYMADDIAFKRDFMTVNGSLPQVLRFVLSHTGMKAGLAERFRALVHIFQNGGQIAQELMDTRCDRGAEIARKMRFSEAVALGIRQLDEHWDGGGMPNNLARDAILLSTRVRIAFASGRSSTFSRLPTVNRGRFQTRNPKPGPAPGSILDWHRPLSASPRGLIFGKRYARTTCEVKYLHSSLRKVARL